jgi:hypothetical protein
MERPGRLSSPALSAAGEVMKMAAIPFRGAAGITGRLHWHKAAVSPGKQLPMPF